MVGAIVLVALAVIFIPMLLSGHRDTAFLDANEVVPEKPAELQNLTSMELQAPIAPPAAREQVRTPVDEKTPRDKPGKGVREQTTKPQHKPAKPVPEKPKQAKTKPLKPAPLAWVVQLGSFSKRDNAMRLRDKVRGKGYAAFVEKLATSSKVVYRVRVGPEIKRGEAEQIRKAILAKLNIKGLVVRHP